MSWLDRFTQIGLSPVRALMAKVSPRPEALRSIRALLGLILGVAAALVVAQAGNAIYPLRDWLFWQYGAVWLWLLLFSASCASFGQLLLVRVFRQGDLPPLESAVLSMVLGTLSFVMGMYAAGALGLFQAWFAVVLPLALWLPGFGSGLRLWHRLWRMLAPGALGPAATVAMIFGCCCLGSTYLRILTPDALGYDSLWFYSKIAQDYARWGHIGAFPGDYASELPHLSSLLYTWGYLLPGLHLTLRWVFAMHMEMCLLLWTLAGIAAAVARMVEPPRPRMTWAVFFLFPGSFVFALWGTGDHVTAFFAIGTALALLLAISSPTCAAFALLAVPIAGGFLTKYQVIYLAVPALAVALGAWAMAIRPSHWRSFAAEKRRDLLWAPVALGLTFALLVLPHLLQNILFHRNPVYPLMQRLFTHSVPVVPNGALYFDHGMYPGHLVPHGTFFEKLVQALRFLGTPMLEPHSWTTAACSPFVLLLPALLFLPRRRASVALAVVGLGALIVWGMLLFDMRHIETFAPVLVAVTASIIVRLWRLGVLARFGLVPMLVMQLAWGIDCAFSDASPGIDSSVRLIRKGLEGKGVAALDDYLREYVALGRAVPENSKLVIHTFGVALGINRDIFMDSPGFQGQIYYGALRTPRELYDRFRELGVTHLVHTPHGGFPSPTKQEDILFHGLAAQYGAKMGAFGHLYLTGMPAEPPPVEAPYRVLCSGLADVADGFYPIEELRNLQSLPAKDQFTAKPEELTTTFNQRSLLERADAVLCPLKGCQFDRQSTEVLERRFEKIGNLNSPWSLYEKRGSRQL